MINAFEHLGIRLHVMAGSDIVGDNMTKVRSSSTEKHIINRIAELQPSVIISINNHGMTKSVRDYITAPVIKWLFDDVEHYFVHESFKDWQDSFDPRDLVVCYNSELRRKIEDGCPQLRKKPVFLPHATSVDLANAIAPDPKHNISFIGSYLDVSPALKLLQHFGANGNRGPLAIENITKDLIVDHQLDIRKALTNYDLADKVEQIGMRPDDFKRILSDLITSRDRLETVVSLRDLGIAVFGNKDWITPLMLLQGAEKVFQYDGRLNTQVELLKAYQSSRITIDTPNIQNRKAIGGRVVEAMASNTLLITKRQEDSDLYRIFGDDCPVLTYRDLPHLHELCKYYLDHPDERLEIVARCNSLVSQGFDYKDRIISVLGMIGLHAPTARLRVQATIDRLPVDVSHGASYHAAQQAIASAASEGDFGEAAPVGFLARVLAGFRIILGLRGGTRSAKSPSRKHLKALKRLTREEKRLYAIVSQRYICLEFDREAYLSRNPDVAREGVDPVFHFVKFGRHEGREPTFSIM